MILHCMMLWVMVILPLHDCSYPEVQILFSGLYVPVIVIIIIIIIIIIIYKYFAFSRKSSFCGSVFLQFFQILFSPNSLDCLVIIS